MAIQFARIEITGRSSGGNACCKGAYNARAVITDTQTNVTYNFSNKGDNVYHTILLPEYVDKKFNSISEFMNEVERCEKRKDSQLLKDIVLALPDDKELTLEDRINITHLLIEKRGWVKEGLGVQVDIHQPHDGEKNWHAHLLVTTRRFSKDGLTFGAKATDLNPEFKKAGKKAYVVPEAQQIHEELKDIINDYFRTLGLSNRVDATGILPQEHIGPVRMRSVLNQAADRNEEKRVANIEHLKSGQGVLDKITCNSSIFNEADIKRVVKVIPDSSRAYGLCYEALDHKSVEVLYDKNGQASGFYTTKAIRKEELKIMRLVDYVTQQENVVAGSKSNKEKTQRLIDDSKASLSDEQQKALSHLLLDKKGVRILQGRAGTGKSYVLGKVATIAQASGINVIGVAPTHKARTELAKCGYEQNDTIKGLLFKLYNNKTELLKNSLIVVDEAGMVGNDDYKELLRVAAAHKCNVILAGDERQLSSVQRGGMFEVFAKKIGSKSMLEIKRQDTDWGRKVAQAFSCGNTALGVRILEANKRLSFYSTKRDSIDGLLDYWQKSTESVENRLIVTIRNDDVDILNARARICLKKQKILKGNEVIIDNEGRKLGYMQGDRIIFKDNNAYLGVSNGDFATIKEVSKYNFKIKLDDGREVELNPNQWGRFSHGYASTVYKAQGASIKEVHVLHAGFSTMRNSYVALSRHVKDLRLYTNNEDTKDVAALIGQLRLNPERGSSLDYLTAKELKASKLEQSKGVVSKFGSFIKDQFTVLTDKHISDSGYYVFNKPEITNARVVEVLDYVHENYSEHEETNIEVHTELAYQEKAVMGGRNISHNVQGISSSNNLRMSNKQRFYANKTYQEQRQQTKDHWQREFEELKHSVRFKAEYIAKDLLGEPNKQLSTKSNLRFGTHGKLAVRISGEKAGTWYDFSESKGGDLFSLVQHKRGGEFKEVVGYLRGYVGTSSITNLHLVHNHAASDQYVDHHKAKSEEQVIESRKIEYTNSLYDRSQAVETNSIAHHYLQEIRGISCDLGEVIKTTDIFDKGSNKSFPALVAFAVNADNEITGGQYLLLDSKTNNKADIAIPRKSFGTISGSFVNISNGDEKSNPHNITIIAEGIETALSLKQSGIDVRIVCALGISNIKNYVPEDGEQVIIAADNDGKNDITNNTIDKAYDILSKLSSVSVVRPEHHGDFNDILQEQDKAGEAKVREILEPAIKKHVAIIKDIELASQKLNAQYQSLEYEIKEAKTVDEALNAISKKVNFYAELDKNLKYPYAFPKALASCKEAQLFKEDGVFSRMHESSKQLLSDGFKSDKDILKELHNTNGLREFNKKLDQEVEAHSIHKNIADIAKQKDEATTAKEVFHLLQKEQEYLAGLQDNLQHKGHEQSLLNIIKQAHEFKVNDEMNNLLNTANYSFKAKILSRDELMTHFKSANSIDKMHENISQVCYDHHRSLLTKHCNKILAGGTIKHQGQDFDCVVKYLEHWKEHVDHKLLPIEKMDHVIDQHLEQQRQMERSHSMSI